MKSIKKKKSKSKKNSSKKKIIKGGVYLAASYIFFTQQLFNKIKQIEDQTDKSLVDKENEIEELLKLHNKFKNRSAWLFSVLIYLVVLIRDNFNREIEDYSFIIRFKFIPEEFSKKFAIPVSILSLIYFYYLARFEMSIYKNLFFLIFSKTDDYKKMKKYHLLSFGGEAEDINKTEDSYKNGLNQIRDFTQYLFDNTGKHGEKVYSYLKDEFDKLSPKMDYKTAFNFITKILAPSLILLFVYFIIKTKKGQRIKELFIKLTPQSLIKKYEEINQMIKNYLIKNEETKMIKNEETKMIGNE